MSGTDPQQLELARRVIERSQCSWGEASDLAEAHVRLTAENADLRRQLSEAREALKPFARAGSWGGLYDHNSDRLPGQITIQRPQGEQVFHITAADLRRAAEAMEKGND